MNALTSYAVHNLPVNSREHESKGRKRIGFHVFLSRYFFDFYKLTIYEQQEHIFSNLGVKVGEFNMDDDQSVDSTDSILKEKVPMHDVHRSACRL